MYRVVQKTAARFRELATELVTNSRNLADVFGTTLYYVYSTVVSTHPRKPFILEFFICYQFDSTKKPGMSMNWLILWKTSDFVVDTLIETTSPSSPQKVTGQPSHKAKNFSSRNYAWSEKEQEWRTREKIVQFRVGRLVIMLCSPLGTTDLKSPPWFWAELRFEQESVNVSFIPQKWEQEYVRMCPVICQERKITLTKLSTPCGVHSPLTNDQRLTTATADVAPSTSLCLQRSGGPEQ